MLTKIKNWMSKPSKDRFNEGYTKGMQDSDDSMRKIRAYYMDEIEKIKNKQLESWMTDPNFVFSVSKTGLVLLNGEQLSTPELKNLKSEVRALKEFQIYKVLQHTLRQKAIEKAILTSTDLYSPKGNEQVLAGKMMIYSLDIVKTIIESVDNAKVK